MRGTCSSPFLARVALPRWITPDRQLIGSKSLSALPGGLMISTMAVQLELPPPRRIRCRISQISARMHAHGLAAPARTRRDNTSTRSSRIDIGCAYAWPVNFSWNDGETRTRRNASQEFMALGKLGIFLIGRRRTNLGNDAVFDLWSYYFVEC